MTTREQGFSYIELMIAVTIMLVGIMALGGALVKGVVTSSMLEDQLRAKEYASSTIEAIYSVRDISKLGFDAAQNVSPAYGSTAGIFVNGKTPIKPDAGPDGIIGTADDSGAPVVGFEREIVIKVPDGLPATEYDTLRQIDVTIYYGSGASKNKLTVSAYIGNYRQVN
jgi:type II secretory pathway pseudopilin PulG